MSNVTVRVGTPEDVNGVMTLLTMACEENCVPEFNAPALFQDVWPALHRDQGIVGVIGAPGKNIEGVILLKVSYLWYSHRRILENRIVFVHPDYRIHADGRARKLCEFSKEAAEELSLPLFAGVTNGKTTRGQLKMYERLLGKVFKTYFLYDNNDLTGATQAEGRAEISAETV